MAKGVSVETSGGETKLSFADPKVPRIFIHDSVLERFDLEVCIETQSASLVMKGQGEVSTK